MKNAELRKGDLTLISNVECTQFFWERFKGLLGRDSLPEGRAMYLDPCGSIHTFFMRFNIDLIFLSKQMKVLKIVRDVPPYRVVAGGGRAWSVVEIQSGWFPSNAISVGDDVVIS